jgi:hypothetical protein
MGLTKSWACVKVHRRDISKIGPAMKIKVVFLLSALILTTPLFARTNTDVLVMKNGDRMTCQVKGLDEGVLYVSFDYIDGTASVQWSKVAHLQSTQLFIVKTEDGSVYTGTLNTPETPAGQPIKIQVIEGPEKEVVLDSPKIVGMSETSEKFWQRFNGQLNFGVIYSKGNQSTQYSLGSQAEYLRARWSAGATLSSNLSSSSGTSASTRNLLDLSGSHLLPWNNYILFGLRQLSAKLSAGNHSADYHWRWPRTLPEEHEPKQDLAARRPREAGYELPALHSASRQSKSCSCGDRLGPQSLSV